MLVLRRPLQRRIPPTTPLLSLLSPLQRWLPPTIPLLFRLAPLHLRRCLPPTTPLLSLLSSLRPSRHPLPNRLAVIPKTILYPSRNKSLLGLKTLSCRSRHPPCKAEPFSHRLPSQPRRHLPVVQTVIDKYRPPLHQLPLVLPRTTLLVQLSQPLMKATAPERHRIYRRSIPTPGRESFPHGRLRLTLSLPSSRQMR